MPGICLYFQNGVLLQNVKYPKLPKFLYHGLYQNELCIWIQSFNVLLQQLDSRFNPALNDQTPFLLHIDS